MYSALRERIQKLNKIAAYNGASVDGKSKRFEPTPTPTPTPTASPIPTNTPAFTNTSTPTRTPTPTPTPTTAGPSFSAVFLNTFIGPGESEFGFFYITSEYSDTIYYNPVEGLGNPETMIVNINNNERMIIDYTDDRNNTIFGIKLQGSQTIGPQLTARFVSGEVFLAT